MDTKKAYIYEIFSSIQGEGIYIGERHIFVRFCGCNLRCKYCDTKYAWINSKFCLIRKLKPIKNNKNYISLKSKKIKNPIPLDIVLTEITKLTSKTKTISLTGGEPLIQIEFLEELIKKLKSLNYKLLLETNGTLYNEIQKIENNIDIISMDLKLNSSCGCGNLIEAHKKFLKNISNKNLIIKVVVTKETNEKEFKNSILSIKKIRDDFILIIQPSSNERYNLHKLLSLQDIALDNLDSVRIIPQIHKLMKIK